MGFSFLWLTNVVLCSYFIVFICLFKEWELGCFCAMAIRRNALVTKQSQIAPENTYFLYIHIEVRLLEHVAVLFFVSPVYFPVGLWVMLSHLLRLGYSIDLPLVPIVAIVTVPMFLLSLSRNDFFVCYLIQGLLKQFVII